MNDVIATVEAKQVLDSANFDWLDGTYTNNIPDELQDETDSTLCLITEINNSPFEWGNSTFTAVKNEVEVQIFYAKDFGEDIQIQEIKIMKLFEAHHWRVSDSKPHYTDPDTRQTIKVFYFTKINQIQEEK